MVIWETLRREEYPADKGGGRLPYLITFLEGLISFISPCMLPMLPVYVSYFAPGDGERRGVWPRALAFVLGFTAVFSLLGLFAGTLSLWLSRYHRPVEIVCGALVILFGLGYLEVIPLPFFRGMRGGRRVTGVFSAFLFGVIYSVSLTPCVGAFLGSALMLASASGTALRGLSLLVVYSLGLGVPFFLSAVLLEQLRAAFAGIRRHYKIINLTSGLFLILVGLAMTAGWLGGLLSALS